MNTYFTEMERELLLFLLQKEEKTIEVELNHTFQREYRSILKERMNNISQVMEKLKVNEPVFA